MAYDYGCNSPCIYMMEGNNDSKYCFKPGMKVPVCEVPGNGGGYGGGSGGGYGGGDGGMGGGGNVTAAPGGGGDGSGETPTDDPSGTPSTSQCKCGVQNSFKRVVGGADTEVNEYPWMVGLRHASSSRPSCGATLISSQWLVTAAHCVVDSFLLDVAVLGEHDVTIDDESLITIDVDVTEMIRHPDYSAITYNNDIALLRLASPVDTSLYVPACLPKAGSDYVDKLVWVLGWGRTQENGEVSDVLQELELKVVDDATCYEAMDGDTFADEQICAGGDLGKDGCQGDSGGPLAYNELDRWELAGVTSWGIGCAREGKYGVYTEVPNYLDWIIATISNYEKNDDINSDNIHCY